MLVLAVGEDSEWGRTMALVVGEVGDTPLQEKLGGLATAIGKLGFIVAVVCFVVLLVRCLRGAAAVLLQTYTPVCCLCQSALCRQTPHTPHSPCFRPIFHPHPCSGGSSSTRASP